MPDIRYAPGWAYWITKWHWQPALLLFLLLVTAGYIYGLGPWRHRMHPQEKLQASRIIAFILGIGMMFVAFFSPIDLLTHYFFTAHMLQHLLLSLAVPPLLIIGIPAWLAHDLLDHRPVALTWKWLVMPVVAAIIFNGNLWLWHAPFILNRMVHDMNLHIVSQLLFLLTGILFWWPLFGPQIKEQFPINNMNIAGKLLYIFLSDMPMVLLGAGLTFSAPFYITYVLMSKDVTHFSPVLDQQLGGLLMWIPGSIFFIVIASILFLRWILQQERMQQVAEAQAIALEDEEDDEVEERPETHIETA